MSSRHTNDHFRVSRNILRLSCERKVRCIQFGWVGECDRYEPRNRPNAAMRTAGCKEHHSRHGYPWWVCQLERRSCEWARNARRYETAESLGIHRVKPLVLPNRGKRYTVVLYVLCSVVHFHCHLLRGVPLLSPGGVKTGEKASFRWVRLS